MCSIQLLSSPILIVRSLEDNLKGNKGIYSIIASYFIFAPVQQSQIAKYAIENGLKPSGYTYVRVYAYSFWILSNKFTLNYVYVLASTIVGIVIGKWKSSQKYNLLL